MASTEETSADNNNIPSSSGSNEEKKSSSNTEKESGFECNVSFRWILFSFSNHGFIYLDLSRNSS
jgi:hypothetical protein